MSTTQGGTPCAWSSNADSQGDRAKEAAHTPAVTSIRSCSTAHLPDGSPGTHPSKDVAAVPYPELGLWHKTPKDITLSPRPPLSMPRQGSLAVNSPRVPRRPLPEQATLGQGPLTAATLAETTLKYGAWTANHSITFKTAFDVRQQSKQPQTCSTVKPHTHSQKDPQRTQSHGPPMQPQAQAQSQSSHAEPTHLQIQQARCHSQTQQAQSHSQTQQARSHGQTQQAHCHSQTQQAQSQSQTPQAQPHSQTRRQLSEALNQQVVPQPQQSPAQTLTGVVT